MKKDILIDNKLIKKVLIYAGAFGLVIGLLIVGLVSVNNFYKDHYLEFRSPIQSPIVVKDRQLPQNGEIEQETEKETEEVEEAETESEEVEQVVWKTGTVSAYSCGGITTEAERQMNCPNGVTATGTTPRPLYTVACDRANLGKQFHLEGIGTVTCEDLGGAIKGEGRFDLYLETIQEAREFGVQQIAYKLVN